MATTISTTRSGVDPKAIAAVQELFKQAKGLYSEGGDYMKGVESGLERGRGKAVTGGMQGLASAGLANTSLMGGLAKAYEEEVGAPARTAATTNRLSALSGLMGSEAGALASMAPTTSQVTNVTPNYYIPARESYQSTTASPPPVQPQQATKPPAYRPTAVSYPFGGLANTQMQAKPAAKPAAKQASVPYGPMPSGANLADYKYKYNQPIGPTQSGGNLSAATPMTSLLKSYGW
jgi:hypothetical protein